jgi:TRAP-type C4-dicarboxylate transport system permease small subunit
VTSAADGKLHGESPTPKTPARAILVLHRFEDVVLAALLLVMIVLAPLQIVLRDVFGAGISWADPLLRALVLWVGMLGAVAASRDGRHITVDVVSRILPDRARAAADALTSLFATTVSGLVAWHAGRFVLSELRFESTAFSGIPAWTLQSILPFAFGMIALRYGLRFVASVRRAISGGGEAT